MRGNVGEILAITDRICCEHLDAEYAEICRRLVAKLARKRPSPLERGALRVWAAGAIYAVGSNNFLFDPSQVPHLSADRRSARAARHAGNCSSREESDAAVAEVVVTLHLRLRLRVADRGDERLVVSGLLLAVGGSIGHRRVAGAVNALLLATGRKSCSGEHECRGAGECDSYPPHRGFFRLG